MKLISKLISKEHKQNEEMAAWNKQAIKSREQDRRKRLLSGRSNLRIA